MVSSWDFNVAANQQKKLGGNLIDANAVFDFTNVINAAGILVGVFLVVSTHGEIKEKEI